MVDQLNPLVRSAPYIPYSHYKKEPIKHAAVLRILTDEEVRNWVPKSEDQSGYRPVTGLSVAGAELAALRGGS